MLADTHALKINFYLAVCAKLNSNHLSFFIAIHFSKYFNSQAGKFYSICFLNIIENVRMCDKCNTFKPYYSAVGGFTRRLKMTYVWGNYICKNEELWKPQNKNDFSVLYFHFTHAIIDKIVTSKKKKS